MRVVGNQYKNREERAEPSAHLGPDLLGELGRRPEEPGRRVRAELVAEPGALSPLSASD